MHTFSKEALERPTHTLQAAGVLREKAEVICRATKDARADEVVVAVVQRDLNFGGVWTIARESLVRQMSLVEDKGGWSFTFSPDTSFTQIEERCLEFTRIAFRRWEAMQRWATRQR